MVTQRYFQWCWYAMVFSNENCQTPTVFLSVPNSNCFKLYRVTICWKRPCFLPINWSKRLQDKLYSCFNYMLFLIIWKIILHNCRLPKRYLKEVKESFNWLGLLKTFLCVSLFIDLSRAVKYLFVSLQWSTQETAVVNDKTPTVRCCRLC